MTRSLKFCYSCLLHIPMLSCNLWFFPGADVLGIWQPSSGSRFGTTKPRWPLDCGCRLGESREWRWAAIRGNTWNRLLGCLIRVV